MGERAVRVGLFLPGVEGAMAGGTARWADMLAIARRADDLGFDSLWFPDHTLFAAPEGRVERLGCWEAWTWLAALAAVTSRVELGPLVSPTSFRNPALLAKMATDVDEISGGRVVLGLGAGWNEVEYAAFGYPFDHRVSRFEEALQVVVPLLREGTVDFDGRYYQARDCELRPRGPRAGGPPILIGTRGQRMLRLTARYADLWNGWATAETDPARYIPEQRAEVDAACREVGREPTTLGRTAALQVAVAGAVGYPKGFPGWHHNPIRGTAEQIAETLRAFGREGISHVQIWLDPATPAGVEALAPVLAELDRG
jgi:probable F420-dependent oxidoreductase